MSMVMRRWTDKHHLDRTILIAYGRGERESKGGEEREGGGALSHNECMHTHTYTYRCIYHISVSSTVYPFTHAQFWTHIFTCLSRSPPIWISIVVSSTFVYLHRFLCMQYVRSSLNIYYMMCDRIKILLWERGGRKYGEVSTEEGAKSTRAHISVYSVRMGESAKIILKEKSGISDEGLAGFICMCVHVYIYIHIHIYMYSYIHIYVHIFMYIYVYIYTSVLIHIHVYVYI